MHLGDFDLDWGSIVSDVVKAGAGYATAKSKIDAQTALEKAKIAAQTAAMQQAQQASMMGATVNGPLVMPSDLSRFLPPQPPSWTLPAAIVGGTVVLALLLGSTRRRA